LIRSLKLAFHYFRLESRQLLLILKVIKSDTKIIFSLIKSLIHLNHITTIFIRRVNSVFSKLTENNYASYCSIHFFLDCQSNPNPTQICDWQSKSNFQNGLTIPSKSNHNPIIFGKRYGIANIKCVGVRFLSNKMRRCVSCVSLEEGNYLRI